MVKGRVVAIEFFDLILGEIADAQLSRRRHRTVHRGKLARKQARKRRLAIAIAAKQRDAVVGIEAEVEAAKDGLAYLIADRGIVEDA
jgi:hypothetical protein